jgi:hypothetical protein
MLTVENPDCNLALVASRWLLTVPGRFPHDLPGILSFHSGQFADMLSPNLFREYPYDPPPAPAH